MRLECAIVAFLAVASYSLETDNLQLQQIQCLTCVHYVKSSEFPHQVSLQIGDVKRPDVPFMHLCGGSILSEYYILTSAMRLAAVEGMEQDVKQFKFVPPDYQLTIKVKAGKLKIDEIEETEQESIVEKRFKHYLWEGKPLITNGFLRFIARTFDLEDIFDFIFGDRDGWKPGPYDVAIFKLKTPLRLNKNVAKVRLPEKDIEPSGLAVMLAGWNPTLFNDTDTNLIEINRLRKVYTQIIPQKECNKVADTLPNEDGEINRNLVHETNICTRPINAAEFSCDFDAGGPLIKEGASEDKPDELIGLASWLVSPCNSENSFTVFVRVSSVLEWIKNIIAQPTSQSNVLTHVREF